ncbi:hypothetical protein [Flavobacterium sp. W20_MBD1_R3]|uniref:hypothetical protein n=1 Tax=Flavobacterium sp. W20_MBD1_R3 TaxID=3240278 RepID=UPI003F9151C8
MKNKIVLLWVLSVFVMTLSSCSNDSEDNSKWLIKVVETNEKGTSETTVFTYNDNEIVSIDGAQKRTAFTYSDGLITKTITLDKKNQLLETIEYSYLKSKLSGIQSLGNYRINYIHNSDNTVSYERFTIISANQQVKEFHGTLYFENENLIKDDRILDKANPGVIANYSVSYDYDLKKKPLFHIKGFKELLNQNEKISLNNNIISTVITSVSKDVHIASSAILYKSSYTYDLDNYPTERVSETAIFDDGNVGYLKTEYWCYCNKYLLIKHDVNQNSNILGTGYLSFFMQLIVLNCFFIS